MLLYIAHVHVCMYLLSFVTNYDNYIFTFLGFKMSCLKDEVLLEPTIKLVDEYCLISTSNVIKVLNIISIYNVVITLLVPTCTYVAWSLTKFRKND